MLAGDLGRRTGRSESYPSSSLGVPRQVLTHGAVNLTFRGGQFFGVSPLAAGGIFLAFFGAFLGEETPLRLCADRRRDARASVRNFG